MDESDVCTPVLETSGERLLIRHPRFSDDFDHRRGPGNKGVVTDLETGKHYRITGKPCDIPTCHCDAWAYEIDDEGQNTAN